MATAKKEEKKAIMGCTSSGHITKLKQSIFAFRYLWVEQSTDNPKFEGSNPALSDTLAYYGVELVMTGRSLPE